MSFVKTVKNHKESTTLLGSGWPRSEHIWHEQITTWNYISTTMSNPCKQRRKITCPNHICSNHVILSSTSRRADGECRQWWSSGVIATRLLWDIRTYDDDEFGRAYRLRDALTFTGLRRWTTNFDHTSGRDRGLREYLAWLEEPHD